MLRATDSIPIFNTHTYLLLLCVLIIIQNFDFKCEKFTSDFMEWKSQRLLFCEMHELVSYPHPYIYIQLETLTHTHTRTHTFKKVELKYPYERNQRAVQR